jgi:aminocarboxymuconate-semialdehyde decarboxylase
MPQQQSLSIIDSRSFDAKQRLDDMVADHVDGFADAGTLVAFPVQDADALRHHVKLGNAKLRVTNPRPFQGICSVPMQDAAMAVRRLEELKSLGLEGIEIVSHGSADFVSSSARGALSP